MRPRLRMLLFGACVGALATTARAAAPERRLDASALTQLDPVGLQLDASLGWSWRLFDSDAALLRDAHFAAGLAQSLSPAHSRSQAWLELSPLSILDLRASADFAAYFGTFGHLVGLPSYQSDFSDEARQPLEDAARAASGGVFTLAPTLKLAVGRVAFATTASFEWWRVDGPPPYFYEPFRDTLLASDGDSLLALQSVLLYDVSRNRDRTRQVGALYERVEVWDAPGNRRQRLGPFVSWRLAERGFGVAQPTLLGGILPYFDTRHRGGISAIVLLRFRLGR